MKTWIFSLAPILFMVSWTIAHAGVSKELFYPQVPFNLLYAGGVEHTFIRLEHPQWDAAEFHTNASGGVIFLITLLDGTQIHYLDQEPLVQMRRKFDTSSKARNYRYAPMECRSKIGKDGVEVTFWAKTDLGNFKVNFHSSGPLKELNQAVDPYNHSMEVIPILYMEKTVSGDEKTDILLDGKPLKIKKGEVSFTQGAHFGIIFRTDQRDEKRIEFVPGQGEWMGARWIYDLQETRVTYSIEKEKDSEGYYEVKRLGNNMVQKAWLRPVEKGREVKRISTYSLVHDNREFIVEFEPPLFFPVTLQERETLENSFDFKVKISNSPWVARGRVKMVSKEETGEIRTVIDLVTTSPEFLAKRPIRYEVTESAQRYQVIATER